MQTIETVRILIVDDKPDKATALGAIVSDLGEIVTVHSGKEALRRLMTERFAVILLDINMPVMDGFETAALIRQKDNCAHTPIIFITSFYDAETYRARAYQLGAVDYILAPVIPEVLKAKVAVFVDLFKKTEEVQQRAEERVTLMREQIARVTAEAARAAAEQSERRAAFLSDASRMLASSLDYDATIKRIAELSVLEICDWCAIGLIEEGQKIRFAAITHSDPAKAAHLATISTDFPPHPTAEMLRVIRTGEAELIDEITDEVLRSWSQSDQHFELLKGLKLRSCMTVPLRARERMLGAMKLSTAESGRRLGPRDLALAEDLGRRVAVAIDNSRLYQEAQQANRMKDEFLAVLSHELRTPLTPILGWTRILRNGPQSPERLTYGLDIIERNVKAQMKLIEDLLDVSRIITGKMRLNMRSIELQPVLQNSIDSIRPAADAKQIQLNLKMESERRALYADPERVQQIVWNLLSNAIKFTPKRGEITVRLLNDDSNSSIEITDSGIGISQKFLPHVFERFQQADSSTTRAFGGLGLGLAIVRHLVELHGGTVQATSPGEGKGATFTVTIPSHRVAPVDTDGRKLESKRVVRSGKLDGLNVMIVEDEIDTRELLAALFQHQGANVFQAGSASEALQVFESTRVDLLLSDIGMPGDDGYALISKLRSEVHGATVPAIALTAYARDEDRTRAIAAGYQLHIPKPVDPEALLTSASALLMK
jgi:signal transduction histidine kinase/DNA-binding response OmpR family regulator